MAITKGTPRRYFDGIEANDGGELIDVRDSIPMHCPLWFIQAPQGDTRAQFLSLSAAKQHFGKEAFNEFGKYFSHQTQGAITAGGEGNLAFFMRCVSATAKKARLSLNVEYVEDTVDRYQVDPVTKKVIVDAITGLPVLDTGVTAKHLLVRWFVSAIDPTKELGASVAAGVGVNPAPVDGTASTVLSIWEFESPEYGVNGDNNGFRLTFPNSGTLNNLPNPAFAESKVLPVSFEFVRRENSMSTGNIVVSRKGAKSTVVGVYDKVVRNAQTNVRFFHENLVKHYSRMVPGEAIVTPVVGKTHFYKVNYDLVLAAIKATEDAIRVLPAVPLIAAADLPLINPFILRDFGNNLLIGCRTYAGSLVFGNNTTLYMQGGDDGVVSETELATLVEGKMTTMWNDPASPMADRLRYPFRNIWDTGYPMSTKTKLYDALDKRFDIGIDVCTQDLLQPDNDLAAETSISALLRTAARMHPESVVHGTEVCRVGVWGHMGEYGLSNSERRLPLIFDIIRKAAKLMGAAEGGMTGERMDNAPYNEVKDFIDVTNTWAEDDIHDQFWVNGNNYVVSKGLKKLFWPAYQTVYSDDTSILNSWIYRAIALDIIAIQDYIWTQLVGNTDLSKPEFIQESNRLFDLLTANRYQSRVQLERKTYFTAEDEQRNYSWTMDVAMFGNGMKTAGALNLRTARPVVA